MCRGGRVHSSIALEHFLGEGGGGAVWAVTAAAVVPLSQRLLTSVKVRKSHLRFLWKMQIPGVQLQKFWFCPYGEGLRSF